MIGTDAVVWRILIAAALGAVLGFEREARDRPAGLRTHIMVALGACLFSLISAYGFGSFIGEESPERVSADPTRVASQIVVGIGFLGGGTILRYRGEVRGLTTAASLWVVAAVGTAIGLGFYVGGVVTAAIGLFSLGGLRAVEQRVRPSRTKKEREERAFREAGDEDQDEETSGPHIDHKGWPRD